MTTDPQVIQAALHELGETIRGRRVSLGWSIRHLSERSGVSIGMLSAIETAERAPSVATLLKVAHGLGMSPVELLSDIPIFGWTPAPHH